MKIGDWILLIQTIVLGFTAYFAWMIGEKQVEINKQIQKMEDSAELFGYVVKGNNETWFLRLTNVGKVQLYLIGYSINGVSKKVDFALIPSGQQQNAWYDIKLPPTEISVELHIFADLEDHLSRHWRSEIELIFKGGGWEAVTHKMKINNIEP